MWPHSFKSKSNEEFYLYLKRIKNEITCTRHGSSVVSDLVFHINDFDDSKLKLKSTFGSINYSSVVNVSNDSFFLVWNMNDLTGLDSSFQYISFSMGNGWRRCDEHPDKDIVNVC